jgi:hypothetical protein
VVEEIADLMMVRKQIERKRQGTDLFFQFTTPVTCFLQQGPIYLTNLGYY